MLFSPKNSSFLHESAISSRQFNTNPSVSHFISTQAPDEYVWN